MFHTSARMIMSGIAAIALGAISGWVIIDKLPKRSQDAPARAATLTLPESRTVADDPVAPARPSSKAAAPAAPPAATTPPPARVAAPATPPAAEPAKEPAAKPAVGSPDKPQIRVDPGRGEGSIDIGDAGISADKNGRIRIKGPSDTGFSFDPEEGEFKVRTPKGTFKIDW